MKRKLLILFFIVFIFSFGVVSCKKEDKSAQDIIDWFKDLNSYTCDMTIEVKNSRQDVTYEGKQIFQHKNGYRMEIGKDRVFIYRDGNIHVNDLSNKKVYNVPREFDEIYRLSFIGEYINLIYINREVKCNFKDIEGQKYAFLKVLIPGNNRNATKAVMKVDVKTNYPCELSILDYKDKESIKVTYKNFLPNERLDNSMFKITQ